MENTISNESTEEEVIKFFLNNKCQLSEDVQNKIKKENITGDVLPLLPEKELKSDLIGLKFGHVRTMKLYLDKNKDNFKDKEIEEKIYPTSSQEEIKNFLKKSLNFELTENLNGEKLLSLKEEDMEKIGLSLGKRKKLLKYIEYFKTLKLDESIEAQNENLLITRKSSKEEVDHFLKYNLKFSKDSIDELNLDGAKLYNLKENEINEFNLSTEEKDKLKTFLNEMKENEKKKIKITPDSDFQEVAIFMKEILEIPEDTIQDLSLNGEVFFSLNEEDIDGFEISEEQKVAMKNYLKELKSEEDIIITEESTKEDVKNFLIRKLSFDECSAKIMEYDGKSLLALKEFEIKGLNIKEEEKSKLTEYLEKDKIKVFDENDEKSIAFFLDEKFGLSAEKFGSEELKKISKEITEQEKIILLKFISLKVLKKGNQNDNDKNNENIIKKTNNFKKHFEKDKRYHKIQNLSINKLIKNNKQNIFFFLALNEEFYKNYFISVYNEFHGGLYLNYKPIAVDLFSTPNETKNYKIITIQITSEEKISILNISLNEHNEDICSSIRINDNIQNYFYLDNLDYDTYLDTPDYRIDSIIYIYESFIFDASKNIDKTFKIGLLKTIFD